MLHRCSVAEGTWLIPVALWVFALLQYSIRRGLVSFIPVSTEKILRRGLTSGIRDLAYSAAKGKSNGDGDG